MVWILYGIWNPEAQPFKIRTNGSYFVRNHLKSRQKWPYFEWSGFLMFETIAIAIAAVRPCDKLNHLKDDLQKVQIANVSRFRKVRFQIPTIIKFFFRARSLRTTTNRCLPLRTFRQSWFRRQNIDRQQQFAENWRLKTCRKIGATFQKASNYRQSWKCRKSDGR